MFDKLDYYDIIGIVVPGVLLAYWLPICFPQTLTMLTTAGFPESIDVIGFTAASIFLGHLLQALASVIEKPLYASWGGRPSELALDQGLGNRYVSAEMAQRIRSKLVAAMDSKGSDQDLFLWAMERAKTDPISRSERFNALFGYHRALLALMLVGLVLLLTSAQWGEVASWPDTRVWAWSLALGAFGVLLWHRSKQRAFYYVREVLLVVERGIDASTSPASSPRPAEQEKP